MLTGTDASEGRSGRRQAESRKESPHHGLNLAALTAQAKQAERFLKALANAHRLMILCELHKGDSAVTPLQQKLNLSQSSLSQHLARLRLDSLVKTRRQSQTIHYRLASDEVARAIELIYEMFCGDAPPKSAPPKINDKGGRKSSDEKDQATTRLISASASTLAARRADRPGSSRPGRRQ
ncbi:hypothetical protein DSM21852_37300 [Methylocystis bryophila]|nr:hypothetical protein DSM21852_37300 [Methylocystis bryophila]